MEKRGVDPGIERGADIRPAAQAPHVRARPAT